MVVTNMDAGTRGSVGSTVIGDPSTVDGSPIILHGVLEPLNFYAILCCSKSVHVFDAMYFLTRRSYVNLFFQQGNGILTRFDIC